MNFNNEYYFKNNGKVFPASQLIDEGVLDNFSARLLKSSADRNTKHAINTVSNNFVTTMNW